MNSAKITKLKKILGFIILTLGCDHIYSVFSTTNFWKSTQSKFIRGSHWDDLNPSLLESTKNNTSVDFFMQTTWGMNKSPGIFTDILDIDEFKNELLVNVQNKLESFGITTTTDTIEEGLFSKDSYSSFKNTMNNLTVEDVSAGLMLRLGTTFDNDIRIGLDLPVIHKITHFWVKDGDITRIVDLIENFIKNTPPDFPALPTKDEQDKLLYLVSKQSNTGVGDLRFSVESPLWKNPESKVQTTGGLEFFFAPHKPNIIIPEQLSSKRNQLLLDDIFNHGESFFLNNNEENAQALKQDMGYFIDNIFATLNENYFSTQIDNFRPGFGIFVKSSLFSTSRGTELFSRIRADYLFTTDRVVVYPTKDYNTLINSGFITHLSPLLIMQGDLGISLHWEKLHFTVGYDFFIRSKELIESITDPFDNNHRDLTEQLDIRKAQANKKTLQHKVFSSIIYKAGNKNNDYSIGMSGNYTFKDNGFTLKTWGLVFSLGFGF